MAMNSNRSINGDVVQERVHANLNEFDSKGKYCEFGQINLLILDTDPSMTFLIMDGQVHDIWNHGSFFFSFQFIVLSFGGDSIAWRQ